MSNSKMQMHEVRKTQPQPLFQNLKFELRHLKLFFALFFRPGKYQSEQQRDQ